MVRLPTRPRCATRALPTHPNSLTLADRATRRGGGRRWISAVEDEGEGEGRGVKTSTRTDLLGHTKVSDSLARIVTLGMGAAAPSWPPDQSTVVVSAVASTPHAAAMVANRSVRVCDMVTTTYFSQVSRDGVG